MLGSWYKAQEAQLGALWWPGWVRWELGLGGSSEERIYCKTIMPQLKQTNNSKTLGLVPQNKASKGKVSNLMTTNPAGFAPTFLPTLLPVHFPALLTLCSSQHSWQCRLWYFQDFDEAPNLWKLFTVFCWELSHPLCVYNENGSRAYYFSHPTKQIQASRTVDVS